MPSPALSGLVPRLPGEVKEVARTGEKGRFAADFVEQIEPELAARAGETVVAVVVGGNGGLCGGQGDGLEAGLFVQRDNFFGGGVVAVEVVHVGVFGVAAVIEDAADPVLVLNPLGDIAEQVAEDSEAAYEGGDEEAAGFEA